MMPQSPFDWPFDEPTNVAVITTWSILNGKSWIALVTRDADDGTWQFIPLEGASMADAAVVALSNMLKHDPSIVELADLPCGWRATRSGPDAPWVRAPSP
jgi:hypothetical protein